LDKRAALISITEQSNTLKVFVSASQLWGSRRSHALHISKMTLPQHALQYYKCSKDELRTFVMQRLSLSGREFSKSSKRDLVKRLLRLDQLATFRLLDFPAEILEQCIQNAVECASDFRRLLLVSKLVHLEATFLFYKDATFEVGFVSPRCPSRGTGNPIFGMRTTYWNHIDIHENPSGVSFAKTFSLQHNMFRNIRHLSLKGEMLEIASYGAGGNRYWLGASRLIFLTSVFYAFNDSHTQLKTLTFHVEGHRAPSMLTAYGLRATFWPLKLLAGRVKVQIRSMRKELANRINLHENDLDAEVIEACQHFAQCFFSHKRPSLGVSDSLEATRAKIFEKKMANLAASNIPFLPDENERLVKFVKRMEYMEVEQLGLVKVQDSWILTRAWVCSN